MEIAIKYFNELAVDELFAIFKLRNEVFIVEQHCPYQDIDEADRQSYHLLLSEKGQLLAYLRIIPAGVLGKEARIGRVVARFRRRGYATMIVKEALSFMHKELGVNEVLLEAQLYAVSLYEKCGFERISAVFLEDGIEHVRMKKHGLAMLSHSFQQSGLRIL